MKKTFLPLFFVVALINALSAQCPSQIQDQFSNGSAYLLTLTSIAQCPAPGSNIALNSVNYGVNDCGDLSGDGTILLQLTPTTATQVVLATAAPVTFTFGGNTCSYNAMGVLPIELISFTGKQQNNINHLTWITASESQNKGFDIERSTDGVRFDKIGFVTGNGTTNTRKEYSFKDESPTGLVYYRLKQLDFDGRFEYSKIIAIDRKGENVVSVFPNPSKGVFTITGIEDSEDETFTLINSIGQTLSINVQNNGQLDMSAFPSGVYYLRVASSGQVMKLVKE